MVGGLFSLQPTVTAPQGSAAWVWGLLLGSVTEGGSGPGGREAGLQFGNWKNLAATGGRGGQHTEGPGSCRVSSHRAPIVRVTFRPAPGTSSRPQPSQDTLCSSALRPRQGGGSEDSAPSGKVCGTTGGSGVGRDGPGGGRASVVLKERQEVIVTIARQVGGVQVREELVGVCEFWQEIQRRLRHVGCSLRSGLTL